MTDLAPPRLVRAFGLVVRYDAPLNYASTTGDRTFLRALEAQASGAELEATLADEGGDWLVLRSDGAADLEGRMMLRCPDGENVYWRSRGVLRRDGTGLDGTLALQPFFDTEVGSRDFMTRTVFLATGTLSKGTAQLDVWRLA